MLIVTILSTTAGIFYRYVLNNSLSWVEELCSFLLVWLAYLSAGLATVAKAHIVADFLSRLIKESVQKTMSWIIRILEIVFLAFILRCGNETFPESNALQLRAGDSAAMVLCPNYRDDRVYGVCDCSGYA